MSEIEKALSEVKTLIPAGKTYEILKDVISKDIKILGTDEVFALRDKGGEIKAFKQQISLTEANGGLVKIKGGPHVVSAQGYEWWAEAAGASVIFPRSVIVDGIPDGNPCVARDDEGNIIYVYARAIAFRFSSKGIPQVSDWTTVFDLAQYRMIDMIAKAKAFPQAFKLLPNGMDPKEFDEEGNGTWASYKNDEATTLFVNTSHKECLQWYSQIRNRSKKAVDYAQTFAKRNALKHLSGLQKAPANRWDIPVICWRPTGNNIVKWDATEYAKLQDRVEGLIEGEFDSKIEITKGQEDATSEDEFEALEGTIDAEDSPDAQPEPQKPAPQKKASEEQVVMHKQIHEIKEMFPEEYSTACKRFRVNSAKLFNTPPHEIDIELGKSVLKEINRIVDVDNE